MTVMTAIEEAMNAINEAIENLPRVSAEALGLDYRAGYVYVDLEDRCIIARGSSARSLDYYGGFEYVSEENTTSIGGYKVYSEEGEEGNVCERITEALDHYEEKMEGGE